MVSFRELGRSTTDMRDANVVRRAKGEEPRLLPYA